MVLGKAPSKLETFIWIFDYVFKSETWSPFDLKALNLDRRLILMLSFMWWCQFIDWRKFETRPSSLRNSGMAYTEFSTLNEHRKKAKTVNELNNTVPFDNDWNSKITV